MTAVDPAISTPVTMATDVVLVTGGCGFLGQHIVRLLQERADYVKEIRVFDLNPYSNKLGDGGKPPVNSIVGSITDWHAVESACTGVTSVIHVAGLISFGTFPDNSRMEKVNIAGTDNIIQACIWNGVQRLVYCSTVDVVIGFDPILNGTESTTHKPDKFLFPGYPDSKSRAESLVTKANGRKCVDDTVLRTVSLRANVMYGEGDPYYVTNGLRTARANGGILQRVGHGRALFQQAYVGNTAYAFLCADRALRSNPDLGSQVFYVPDDTPVQNTFCFMKPYLSSRGYRLSTWSIPYPITYWSLCLVEMVLWLISPLIKINLKVTSCSVRYINTDLYFSYQKARRLLNYWPIFSPQVAHQRSLEYYKFTKL